MLRIARRYVGGNPRRWLKPSARNRITKTKNMSRQVLDRREFNGLCAGAGLSLPAVISAIIAASSGGSALADADGATANGVRRMVKFHDGTVVPALGQGSWHLGQGRHPVAVEEEALRTGISLGMTLIDTSEGTAAAVPRN
jgi:hypothetical protein